MTIEMNFDTRLVIWGLDERLTLDQVIVLFNRNYNLQIDYLNSVENLDERDRVLFSNWRPSEGNTFNIEMSETGGQSISYISVIGSYEIAFGETRAYVEGYLLPREYRVFNKTVKTIFIEYNTRVYVILEIPYSQESKIRSILFGQSYKNRIEEWGKVNFNNLPQYTFSSSFFYWLISNKGDTLNITLDDETVLPVSLYDVSAVSQLSPREVYNSRNEGTDILKSVPALSGLGSNQSIYEVGLHFEVDNKQLFFMLSSNGVCNLDSSRSTMINNGQVEFLVESDIVGTGIILYTILLPGLLSLYHRANTWISIQEAQQRKEWAILAIKSLIEENNIQLDEIS